MSKGEVMIVEDEAITALEIRSVVESSNYEVVSVVGRGEDAVEKALTLKPDIILMDVTLKGEMDGVDAARKIKEFQDTPVLYITAIDSVESWRLKNTRGAGLLVKPITEGELLTNMEIAIHNYKTQKEELENIKEEGLTDLQVFMHCTMPNLSSELSIVGRGEFLGAFYEKFEELMKPKFLKEVGRYHKNLSENLPPAGKMQLYFSWIDNFFKNLGFHVEMEREDGDWVVTLRDCNWCEGNHENIFYCLMCQAILRQTFSWTDMVGEIRQISDVSLPQTLCRYKFQIAE